MPVIPNVISNRTVMSGNSSIANFLSSNSTCSICCGFAVQQFVLKIHNKSTTFRFFDKSTTSRHVKMLWICCGLDNKSTTNRNNGLWQFSTCPQQVEKLYNKSTANPKLYDKSYNLLYKKSTTNRTGGV
jgi:hypothetical protein